MRYKIYVTGPAASAQIFKGNTQTHMGGNPDQIKLRMLSFILKLRRINESTGIWYAISLEIVQYKATFLENEQ